jgi:hypothetical protein
MGYDVKVSEALVCQTAGGHLPSPTVSALETDNI